MAKGAYILKIGADISAVTAAVNAAKGEVTSIGEDKVLIQLDYDRGNLADLRAAVQAIADSDPQVRVQVNYDLQSATLKKKLEEQAENTNLYDLFTDEKSGGQKLTNYITGIINEIEDGLDAGLSKVDLADKLKRALDLSASYTKTTDGKYVEDSVVEWLDDLRDGFKSLENYDPKVDIFTRLRDSIERDKTIIRGLELQLEDLKNAGAIDTSEVIDFSGAEKTVESIDEIKNKINETKESVAQKGKVVIFDGIHEQTYDVIEDIDALMEKLEEMAKKMNLPVFQAGDLRKETVNSEDFLPGDSLKFTLSRGTGRSPGTGQYFASNLVDVIEWLNSHSETGFDRGLFATDLSKYGDLLKIPTADYYSDLLELFGSIHALISDGIVDIPKIDHNGNVKKNYKNYSDILNGRNTSEIFDEYQTFFSDFNISLDQFIAFINDERSELRGLADKSNNFDDLTSKLSKNDAFGTKFLKRFTKYNGIDATNLDMDDSSASGNLVFSIDKQNPFDINFGGNEDIARKFYSMVLEKILSSKAKNSDNDIYGLIDSFVDDTQRELMGDKKISSIQDEIFSISKNARQLTFSGLNTSEEEITGLINKLERLQQLQQTINNMKPESAYGKSYEEAGKHIEQLNAQYKQTVAEIERLREADDGSQEIKEQIGLLENLAVAYQNAIKSSIPNDTFPGDWISKYTNIPRSELFGEDRLYQDRKIRQNATDFRNSLDRGILDIYKNGNLQNEDLIRISQENINTSALSEIPEIMERITSAGKEATQTMKEFNDTVSIEDGESREDGLRDRIEELEAEVDYLGVKNRDQADMIERLQDEKWREEERADQAERDLERAERSLQESEERIQELESQKQGAEQLMRDAFEAQANAELDSAEDLSRAMEAERRLREMENQAKTTSSTSSDQTGTEQMSEDTSETERNTEATDENTEAHKENQDVRQESSTSGAQESETESMRENTEETERNTEAQKENREAKEGAADTSRQESQTDATREDTAETERNTEAHKENRESKETSGQTEQATSSTQQTKEDTEETERNTEAHQKNREERERASGATGQQQQTGEYAQKTASDIQEEINALNSLGASAITAAANKDLVKEANITLASQIIGSSIPAIEKEASALKDLASAAEGAANAKKEYSKAGATKSKAKSSTSGSGKPKAEGDADNAKAEAEKQADAYMARIKKLSSGARDYYSNVNASATGRGGVAVNNLIQGYESQVNAVISDVKKLNDTWGEQSEKVKETKAALDEYVNKMGAYTQKDVQEMAARQMDKIKRAQDVRKQQGSGFTSEYQKQLDNIYQTAENISKAASKIDFSDGLDGSKIKSWIEDLKKGENQLKAINDQQNLLATKGSLEKLRGKIAQDMSKGGISGTLADQYLDLKDAVDKAIASLDEAGDAAEKVSKVDMRGLTDQYLKLNATAKENGQLQGGFGAKFAEAINNQSAQFLATYFSFQDIIRYSKQIAQTVIGTDSALIELKKVSDASNERIQDSFRASAETAQELGSTITNVINSTADWARLGYNIDQAEDLARVTTLYQTVGDNMTQESASQSLVSMLQGFQMDASQAERIVDSVNEVANNYAIDTAGIGDALQRSAAAFNAAGTDLNKSIALVTTANAVVQDPASVGTMFKTLSARLRGSKIELQELGEEEDSFTQSTSKLRDTVKAMTGFDIMENDSQYKDLMEILVGIGKEFQNLADVDRAALLEALGGKRATNALSAVLNNYKMIEDAYATAEGAEGSAAREQENYAQSIQYSIDRAKASLEQLANDFLNSGLLKGLVEFGNSALQVIDKVVAKFGSLQSILATIAGMSLLKNLLGADSFAGNIVGAITETVTGESAQKSLIPNIKKIISGVAAKRAAKEAAASLGTSVAEGVADGAAQNAASAASAAMAGGVQAGTNAAITAAESGGASVGAGFLSGIATTLGPVGIAAIVGGAVVTAIALIANSVNRQQIEAARKETLESIKTLEETKKRIDQYKEEYSGLYEKMTDPENTDEETLEYKKQIYDLQQQIVELYGDQVGGIDLVNGGLREQLALLDAIVGKQSASELLEHQSTYNLAKSKMTASKTYDVGDSINSALAPGAAKDVTDLVESLSDYGFRVEDDGFHSTFYLDSDPAHAQDALDKFAQGLVDLASEHADDADYTTLIDKYLQPAIKKAESEVSDITDAWGDIFWSGITRDANKQSGNLVDKLTEAANAYNEAMATGDDAAVKKTEKDYNDLVKEVDNFLKQDDNQIFEIAFEDIGLDETIKKTYDLKNAINSIVDPTSGISAGNGFVDKVGVFEKGINVLNGQQFDEVQIREALNDALTKRSLAGKGVPLSGDANADLNGFLLSLADAYGIADASGAEFEAGVSNIINILAEFGLAVKAASSDTVNSSSSIDSFIKDMQSAFTRIDQVNAALVNSFSGKGLSMEIDQETGQLTGDVINLRDAYKNLDGYNAAALFRRTANGVKVNTRELRKLQAQQEKITKEEFYKKQAELTQKLANAQTQLANKEINAGVVSDIAKDLQKVKDLAAAYNGATSAYQNWLNAQSATEEGAMYDNIRENAMKRGDELVKEGLIGTEEFRAIAELMSGQDLSAATAEEVQDAYKGVDKQVEGTTHTLRDFFAEGKTGVANFVDALKQVDLAKEVDGGIIFENLDTGKLAEQFGTSVDVIESMMHKLKDYGANITWFDHDTFETLGKIDASIEDTRKRAEEKGIKLPVDVENIDSVQDLNSRIFTLQEMVENPTRFGLDNEELEFARELLNELIEKKDVLQGTENGDATMATYEAAETNLDTLTEKVEKFKSLVEDGADIKIENEEEIQQLAKWIEDLPPEVKTFLGFEVDTTAQDIIDKLLGETTTVNITGQGGPSSTDGSGGTDKDQYNRGLNAGRERWKKRQEKETEGTNAEQEKDYKKAKQERAKEIIAEHNQKVKEDKIMDAARAQRDKHYAEERAEREKEQLIQSNKEAIENEAKEYYRAKEEAEIKELEKKAERDQSIKWRQKYGDSIGKNVLAKKKQEEERQEKEQQYKDEREKRKNLYKNYKEEEKAKLAQEKIEQGIESELNNLAHKGDNAIREGLLSKQTTTAAETAGKTVEESTEIAGDTLKQSAEGVKDKIESGADSLKTRVEEAVKAATGMSLNENGSLDPAQLEQQKGQGLTTFFATAMEAAEGLAQNLTSVTVAADDTVTSMDEVGRVAEEADEQIDNFVLSNDDTVFELTATSDTSDLEEAQGVIEGTQELANEGASLDVDAEGATESLSGVNELVGDIFAEAEEPISPTVDISAVESALSELEKRTANVTPSVGTVQGSTTENTVVTKEEKQTSESTSVSFNVDTSTLDSVQGKLSSIVNAKNEIKLDTSGAVSEAENLSKKEDEAAKPRTGSVTVNVNGLGAVISMNSALSRFSGFGDMTVNATVNAESSELATANNRLATFNRYQDKTITNKIITKYETQGTPAKKPGDFVNGTAHMLGTALSNFGGAARVGGDWRTKKDETALMGELGPEIMVFLCHFVW